MSFPDLVPLFDGADYVDVKTIDSAKNLRQFIADFICYTPAWLRFLYKVRGILVRFLGMKQEKMDLKTVSAEDISFTPGSPFKAFTVVCGKEETHFAVAVDDTHLQATLLIAAEPLGNDMNRLHIGTIVHHKHWTGPLYFTIILPFHHLVAWLMMRAGAKS